MIKATVAGKPVQILDVLQTDRGPLAVVEREQPINVWTHGGWAPESISTVPFPLVHNIEFERDGEIEFYPSLPVGGTTRDFYEHY